MIVRVVELTFDKDNLPAALKKLENIAPKVRGMEGCSYLAISSGIKRQGVILTYSHWADTDALNAYRSSDTFRTFWSDVKRLFAEPAKAWSLDPVVELT